MINTIITGGQYDDPTEWNGKNARCKLCNNDAINLDEYCEEHQRCIMCGVNDDCNCKDEWSIVSSCCEAKISDTGLCYKCKDNCDSVWEAENN